MSYKNRCYTESSRYFNDMEYEIDDANDDDIEDYLLVSDNDNDKSDTNTENCKEW